MLASKTPLPVIGVPRPGKVLDGLDALLSIVQMPAGIPVATMAIGEPGAANAAVLALRILGTGRRRSARGRSSTPSEFRQQDPGPARPGRRHLRVAAGLRSCTAEQIRHQARRAAGRRTS